MEQNSERPEEKKTPPKRSERPNEFIRYAGMATQMAVVILLGVWLGRWLDENREFPVFTLICSLVAVAVAIYIVIKDTAR